MATNNAKPMVGKDGKILIGGKVMGYIDNVSINVSRDAVEVSGIGNQWREYLAGPKGWSGSLSGTLVYGDLAQKAIVDSYIAQAADTVKIIVKLSSGLIVKGTIVLTGCDFGVPYADKVTLSANFQGSGELETGEESDLNEPNA